MTDLIYEFLPMFEITKNTIASKLNFNLNFNSDYSHNEFSK